MSLAIPASDGWDVFHQLMREGDLSARLYPDAYLAALAISNGWRLVSFDRDFERFGGLQRLSLSSGGQSGQPTLIQLSDGLECRILMQQLNQTNESAERKHHSITESNCIER